MRTSLRRRWTCQCKTAHDCCEQQPLRSPKMPSKLLAHHGRVVKWFLGVLTQLLNWGWVGNEVGVLEGTFNFYCGWVDVFVELIRLFNLFSGLVLSDHAWDLVIQLLQHFKLAWAKAASRCQEVPSQEVLGSNNNFCSRHPMPCMEALVSIV